MTYRDVNERLKKEGWTLIRQESSHQIWTKHGKGGRIVLAPHRLSAHVTKGMLSHIKRLAGWK